MINVDAKQFWQFSLEYYAKVKPICLAWQDSFNANINLLLLLCYLEQQQWSIKAHTVNNLSLAVTVYNNRITQRVRQLRRRVATLSTLTPSQQQQFKQQLLAVELIAEQQEQQLLVQCLTTTPAHDSINNHPSNLLELYLQLLQQPLCKQRQQQLNQLRQALA
jgi:uncharacterized protein (TIGR02444 family)